jgi:heme-degrading monooxygenase HmoA
LVGGHEIVQELLQRLDGEEVGGQISFSGGFRELCVQVLRKPERSGDAVFVVHLWSSHASHATGWRARSGGYRARKLAPGLS